MATGSQNINQNNVVANWSAISNEVEIIRDKVFQSINKILHAHLHFGFTAIQNNIDPRIEDILHSFSMIGVLLESLLSTGMLEPSEVRIILNSKQMILCIERVALALKDKSQQDYDLAIDMMRKQAQF